MTAAASATHPRTAPGWLLPSLIAYVLSVCTYYVVRAGGSLAENDTAVLTSAIRAALESGSLLAGAGGAYLNGFTYTAVSVTLVTMTGVDPAFLQQVAFPLLSAALVLPAWCMYRELCGGARAAGLAVLLLFAQPEFLFVILRGSHERVLRLFMMVAFWILLRSFQFRDQPRAFATHVSLFYAIGFGLIATNTFFGVSFLAAVTAALAIAWTTHRRHGLVRAAGGSITALGPVIARLKSVIVALAAVLFVILFYVYPPASRGLEAIQQITQKTTQLVLTTDTGTSPYVQVVSGWVSQRAYYALAASDYLLMAGSAFIWLWHTWRWFGWHSARARELATTREWLLWLLYGAFALQGAASIMADRTGLLGSNLQHRSFPSFAMLAVPLVADTLVTVSRRLHPRRLQRLAAPVMAGGVGLIAGLALLKATNEPALSNWWTFYTPHELRALTWTDAHLRRSTAWVGPHERLRTAFAIAIGTSPEGNTWDIASVPHADTRLYILSDVVRAHAARQRVPLPAVAEANRVYDSGPVEIYRQRARTPYQR